MSVSFAEKTKRGAWSRPSCVSSVCDRRLQGHRRLSAHAAARLLSLELRTEASDLSVSLFASLEVAEDYSELGARPDPGSGESWLAFSVANASACSSVICWPSARAASNA